MLVCGADTITGREQAYDLLARGTERLWGLSPLPELARREGGKPFFPDWPRYHFNLSHSGPYALCGLDEAPVGVDIQIVKRGWNPKLPARVCSPEELDWLEGREDRWGSFALLWAMKEARVKYSGEGLRREIRGISVPLPAGEERLLFRDGLRFRLYAGAGWRACVCGETPPPGEILWMEKI